MLCTNCKRVVASDDAKHITLCTTRTKRQASLGLCNACGEIKQNAEAATKGRIAGTNVWKKVLTLWNKRPKTTEAPLLYLGDVVLDSHHHMFFSVPYGSHVCPRCLKLCTDAFSAQRHDTKCTAAHPPGKCVYAEDTTLVFKVDGLKFNSYCQSLCIVGKCLLKDKTLHHDVEMFEFFVLTHDGSFVGYFSRQKILKDKSLSCIGVLPPYQRLGYGYLLIDLSYRLQKKGCAGSPERPFSEQGLRAYEKYWKIEVYNALAAQNAMSIEGVSLATGIAVDDVIYAMELLGVMKNSSFARFELPDVQLRPSRRCKDECIIGR